LVSLLQGVQLYKKSSIYTVQPNLRLTSYLHEATRYYFNFEEYVTDRKDFDSRTFFILNYAQLLYTASACFKGSPGVFIMKHRLFGTFDSS